MKKTHDCILMTRAWYQRDWRVSEGLVGGHAWAQCWHELGLRSAAALRLVVAERPSHHR